MARGCDHLALAARGRLTQPAPGQVGGRLLGGGVRLALLLLCSPRPPGGQLGLERVQHPSLVVYPLIVTQKAGAS